MRILETERLIIRSFRPDDWRDLQAYIRLPEVTRYDTEWPVSDGECQGTVACLAQTYGWWAVCLRGADPPAASRPLIGHIVCRCKEPEDLRNWSLGFIFNPAYWRRGYATEACRRVLGHVFEEMGAHRVEAGCHPENAASWRLMARLGMRREAHHLQNAVVRRAPDGSPIFWDSYIYAMLDEEWFAQRRRAGR